VDTWKYFQLTKEIEIEIEDSVNAIYRRIILDSAARGSARHNDITI